MGRNGVAGVSMAIDADAAPSRAIVHFDATRAGAEIIKWIFGIDAAFNSVTFKVDFFLAEAKRFTHCNHDLLFYEVDASHFLGDSVLDLDAFVDFQKIEVAMVIDDELDSAGVGVMGHFGDANGGFAHPFPQIFELMFNQR